MRIRQVRPEFWQDDVMATLPDAARLFYVGLWNVADDGGWLDWSPARIGALLYPYRAPSIRLRQITAWSAELARTGRLVIHDCGCASIPTLPKHQRISGVQSFPARDKHEKDHATHSPLSDKHSPLSHSPVTVMGSGKRVNETLSGRERAGARLVEPLGETA